MVEKGFVSRHPAETLEGTQNEADLIPTAKQQSRHSTGTASIPSHMARTYIIRDRQRLQSDMSPTQTELEESYRDRREADDRADRLELEVDRLRDKLRREQANYKNAEILYKSLEAAIREDNVKFEEAASSFIYPAGQQLIAHLRATPRDTVDTDARLEASQRYF